MQIEADGDDHCKQWHQHVHGQEGTNELVGPTKKTCSVRDSRSQSEGENIERDTYSQNEKDNLSQRHTSRF
jgi:hypothetical protein